VDVSTGLPTCANFFGGHLGLSTFPGFPRFFPENKRFPKIAPLERFSTGLCTRGKKGATQKESNTPLVFFSTAPTSIFPRTTPGVSKNPQVFPQGWCEVGRNYKGGIAPAEKTHSTPGLPPT